MEHQIKALAELITHAHTKHLVQTHVKELHFENKHLVIYVDNAAPLHEFTENENDKHLKKALEERYGEDITYEVKLHKGHIPHEREKEIPHNIRQ
ncbi:hypothetical protein JXA05_03435 [Candidatus Peregrinibacteria bacterium]|nr:hypothetical protein [Candidatus Peregrinibacteria bacterium]